VFVSSGKNQRVITRYRCLLVGAIAAITVAAMALPIRAQGLPRLHVLEIGQYADRLTVAPHEQFHVTIRVLVAEKRERLDEIQLGDLENCTIVGDERLHASVAKGTEFTERLTLEAQAPGIAVISPAHLDAINASNGKALRYSASQTVSVRVTSFAPFDTTFRAFLGFVRVGVVVVVAVILVALIAFFGLRRRSARPRVAPAVTVVPEPLVSIAPSRDLQLVNATNTYRRSRSVPDLFELRGLLFDAAGVDRGATLADALRALGDGHAALRFALAAAERAAFGPAGERERAGDELLTAVEAYSARRTANPPA
jgi:hypothetical protein